ncbi:excalibur calcium-binding domain-containing protein [Arthrobacter mobilis]|uniref:Excalibur calcium-binding domain-containing protein n=1 Tax=Arthrobacter mobilis TaxID=2724944 RepID=A0A7X6QMH5_9MICC|nr:excalibur calcium-binding domain-containing protein [Arthrobacter mobilis]NKX56762.1 excalibur calcium-binding domain-containing protein [Arthrobacter mobilis]
MHANQSHPARFRTGNRALTVSFRIAAALLVLLPVLFAAGGAGAALVLPGVGLMAGLFALVFKRRSRAGLDSSRAAGTAARAVVPVLVLGLAVTGCTPPAEGTPQTPAAASTAASSPSPSASGTVLAFCDVEDRRKLLRSGVYVCTEDDHGLLVWMDLASHDKVMEEREAIAAAMAAEEAAKKAAAKKKAKEEARKKAAAEKKAKEAVARKKAAAEKKAREEAARQAEQAAQEEAARQAEAQRQAEEEAARQAQQQAPAPAVGFSNCSQARAAGAAPLYRGSPGYSPGLDRDGDGVACE